MISSARGLVAALAPCARIVSNSSFIVLSSLYREISPRANARGRDSFHEIERV